MRVWVKRPKGRRTSLSLRLYNQLVKWPNGQTVNWPNDKMPNAKLIKSRGPGFLMDLVILLYGFILWLGRWRARWFDWIQLWDVLKWVIRCWFIIHQAFQCRLQSGRHLDRNVLDYDSPQFRIWWRPSSYSRFSRCSRLRISTHTIGLRCNRRQRMNFWSSRRWYWSWLLLFHLRWFNF